MGHYDECRDGYCAACGAGPGNIIGGKCQFCYPETKRKTQNPVKEEIKWNTTPPPKVERGRKKVKELTLEERVKRLELMVKKLK